MWTGVWQNASRRVNWQHVTLPSNDHDYAANQNTVKLQIFVRYLFSYFWLETGSYELFFVLSRVLKQNYIEIRWPQENNKFSSGIKFRTFFKSTKLISVLKFVTLQ